MTQQCVNCPGAEDHSTAQCPVMAEASAVVNQQVTAADSLPVGVPDGYMPIPTAEQLADALDGVRCFHDMSAELIAPRLLANLLASTTVKAEQADEAKRIDKQSAQPEFCCKHSYKVAKQAAWGALDLTQCKCDHNEYCEHCWPDDFREGGKWHGGFETKQSAPERVSVPVELLRRVCWPVASGSDRHTHSEAVTELRALLASHAEGGKV